MTKQVSNITNSNLAIMLREKKKAAKINYRDRANQSFQLYHFPLFTSCQDLQTLRVVNCILRIIWEVMDSSGIMREVERAL